MNPVLPSLSINGWITNESLLISKLFMYFLSSKYSQTVTFYKDITSLDYIIAKNISSDDLKNEIESGLIKLYSRYFDVVEFRVEVKETQNGIHNVYISGTLKNNGKTFNLNKELNINNSKVENYNELLDNYYLELKGD